jgi:PTS system fructose-specific IIC component
MRARTSVRFARFAPGRRARRTTNQKVAVLLHEILTPERIRIPLRGTSKDDILRELVETLHEGGAVADAGAVLQAVREREAVLTTGIGSGVGIPHGKSEQVAELALAAGVSEQPVDFQALDGKPCRLFFLLVGPESAAGAHVKALSRISRLVRREEVRERLARAPTPEAFLEIVAESESA